MNDNTNPFKLNEDNINIGLDDTCTVSANFLRTHTGTVKEKAGSCYVCGKHGNITHWHHCVPLKDISKYMRHGVSITSFPMVALCPNCHSYVHKWLNNDFLSVLEANQIENSITNEELEKIKQIAKVRDDFSNIVFRKICNLLKE